MKRLSLLVLLLLVTVPSFPAAEIVLQNGKDGYEAASDTTLIGTNGQVNLNFGSAATLEVAGTSQAGLKRLGVLQFSDLNTIAAIRRGTPLKKATLALFKVGGPKDEGQYGKSKKSQLIIKAFPLLRPWKAGLEKGKIGQGAATFSYRAYDDETPIFWGDSHQIEAGPVASLDYNVQAASDAALDPALENEWNFWDVTKLVQPWLDTPESNHGFLLMARGSYIGAYFASCDAADPSLRPKLIIEY